MTTNLKPVPQVFVSYSRRDAEFMGQLIHRLQTELGDEHVIWFDTKIEPGKNWWEEIKKQIKRSSLFLVILSPNSLYSRRSNWVKREIDIAWQRYVGGKMEIIPVQSIPCKIPDDLNTLNVISFAEGITDQSFQRLVDRLRASTQKNRIIRELDEDEQTRFDSLVKQINETFQQEHWRNVIHASNILRRRYASNIVPPFVYEMQGLAYLHTAGTKQESLVYAEHTIKKALLYVTDSPQYQLDLLDIYAGILISQERWHEIEPLVEKALQCLLVSLPHINWTANDPRVWKALQDEIKKKMEMIGSQKVTVLTEDRMMNKPSNTISYSQERAVPSAENPITTTNSEKTHLFQMNVFWSLKSLRISIHKTFQPDRNGSSEHKAS